MSTATYGLSRQVWISKAAAIIEDVEWLASWGVSFEEIARRVGKAPEALERALYRWGRPDLARLAYGAR